MKKVRKKILIVEDDLALKPLWSHILNDLKVDVMWAISAEESINILKSWRSRNEYFDLIITDIFLAGSSTGLELARYSQGINKKTKIILVSSIDKTSIKLEELKFPVECQLLTKPIDLKQYKPVVIEALSP